jgi:hypothetical protein
MFAFVRELPLFKDLKQKKVRVRDNRLYQYDEICFKTVGIVGWATSARKLPKNAGCWV